MLTERPNTPKIRHLSITRQKYGKRYVLSTENIAGADYETGFGMHKMQ